MILESLSRETNAFEGKLYKIIDHPLVDDSERIRVSDIVVRLSFEHWAGVRELMRNELVISSVVILRTQFEALVKSIWLLYSATDNQVEKLAENLSPESEQAAKNFPTTNQMMADLEKTAPENAYAPLKEFKDNSWKALNSFAHSGIHPIKRREQGRWTISFLEQVFRQSNGLATLCGFQAAILRGRQPLQKEIIALTEEYNLCFTLRN